MPPVRNSAVLYPSDLCNVGKQQVPATRVNQIQHLGHFIFSYFMFKTLQLKYKIGRGFFYSNYQSN